MGKEQDRYTTSRGFVVEIIGLSPFEITDLLKSVPLPEVPTRVVVTDVPGYSEVEQLRADDLRDDEEKAIWAHYVAEHGAATQKRQELATDYVLLEGTRFSMDDLESWKAKRTKWGLSIPEDELDLQRLYFRTHIIGGGEDIKAISDKIAAKSGVDEATLKQAQSTFQRPV